MMEEMKEMMEDMVEMMEMVEEKMEEIMEEIEEMMEEICLSQPCWAASPGVWLKTPQTSAFAVPNASLLPSSLVSSGILYVNKSLDFETSPKFFLSIECTRKGSSSLSDMTTIVVNITDVNEHRPRFLQDLYSTRVLENAIVGDVVLTVRTHNFALWGAWTWMGFYPPHMSTSMG